jgi:hypothetical protein
VGVSPLSSFTDVVRGKGKDPLEDLTLGAGPLVSSSFMADACRSAHPTPPPLAQGNEEGEW